MIHDYFPKKSTRAKVTKIFSKKRALFRRYFIERRLFRGKCGLMTQKKKKKKLNKVCTSGSNEATLSAVGWKRRKEDLSVKRRGEGSSFVAKKRKEEGRMIP